MSSRRRRHPVVASANSVGRLQLERGLDEILATAARQNGFEAQLEDRQPPRRSRRKNSRQGAPAEHRFGAFEPAQGLAHGLVDVEPHLLAVARRILRERGLQFGPDAEIVDDEAARLVAEDAVDAGDRLHQRMALHRLVDIERVQRRRVESGQPHVAHDDEIEARVRVLEPLRPSLRAASWCEDAAVGRGARRCPCPVMTTFNMPDESSRGSADTQSGRSAAMASYISTATRRLIVTIMPLPPATASRRRSKWATMSAAISATRSDAPTTSSKRASLPLARSAALSSPSVSSSASASSSRAVFVRQVELQLGEPGGVVERYGRAVGDRLGHVVSVDHVAEDAPCVAVAERDRGSGEADEGCVGQGLAHIFGEA